MHTKHSWLMVLLSVAGLDLFIAAEAQDAITEIVVAEKLLKEDAAVGPYKQPLWSANARLMPMSETEVYVLPPGSVQFSQWWRGTWPRHGAFDHFFDSEIEIGLPWRFEFDVHEQWVHDRKSATRLSGTAFEATYAFADWGKLPLNPAIKFEWQFNQFESDAYEITLALGRELAKSWHWALNVGFEQQVAGERELVFGAAQTVTYTILDDKLMAGIEMKFERTTDNEPDDAAIAFLAGPGVSWQICDRARMGVSSLFGMTHDSPVAEIVGAVTIELGRSERENRSAPLARIGR